MKRGYKYRIYPTEEQKQYIDLCIKGNVWFWNYALYKINDHYNNTKKHLSAKYDISKDLPILKKEEKTSWLKIIKAIISQRLRGVSHFAERKPYKMQKLHIKDSLIRFLINLIIKGMNILDHLHFRLIKSTSIHLLISKNPCCQTAKYPNLHLNNS